MFSRVRIAIRFFFVGLAVGILLAPRKGEETRRLVREKADRLLNDVLDAATLGTIDSGGTADATESGTTRARGGNGTRTRSTRAKPAGSEAGSETAASEAGV
jgi:gas vesicle protein